MNTAAQKKLVPQQQKDLPVRNKDPTKPIEPKSMRRMTIDIILDFP
jgi:hypothetical protein